MSIGDDSRPERAAPDSLLQDAAPLMDEAAEDATAERESEIAALREQVMRYAADAENTRRRAEREANDARAYAIQRFGRDLLGVADNLARALQAAPRNAPDPAVKNLVLGIEMVERELRSAFENNGLKRVEPEAGARFDANLHQAMMEEAAPDLAAGEVVRTLQPGYALHGRIVRPALVVTAARQAAPAAPEPGRETARSNGSGLPPAADVR